MRVVAPIVEGDGEVAALPILLRRIGDRFSPGVPTVVSQPIRVRRDRFLNREEEFRRHLLLAAAKSGEDGWILVLLDADDDCPAELGPRVLSRLRWAVLAPRTALAMTRSGRSVPDSVSRGGAGGRPGATPPLDSTADPRYQWAFLP